MSDGLATRVFFPQMKENGQTILKRANLKDYKLFWLLTKLNGKLCDYQIIILLPLKFSWFSCYFEIVGGSSLPEKKRWKWKIHWRNQSNVKFVILISNRNGTYKYTFYQSMRQISHSNVKSVTTDFSIREAWKDILQQFMKKM